MKMARSVAYGLFFCSGISLAFIRPYGSQYWMGRVGSRQSYAYDLVILSSSKSDELPISTRLPWMKLPRLYVGEEASVQSISFLGNDCSISQHFDGLLPPSHQSKLQQDRLITLNKDQSHYLTTVLRLNKAKAERSLRLFDGSEEWLAELEDVEDLGRGSKSSSPLVAKCAKLLRTKSERTTPCGWMFVAPPKKKDRSRWLVEKCTELSVGGFVFLQTEFSEKSEKKLSKLLTYALEASEQCERLALPQFLHLGDKKGVDELCVTKLSVMLEAWSLDPNKFTFLVCRERAGHSRSAVEVLQSLPTASKPIAYLIGPEGGWSATEEDLFNQMEARFPDQFYNVILGSTVLRTETAAVAASAIHAMICGQSK